MATARVGWRSIFTASLAGTGNLGGRGLTIIDRDEQNASAAFGEASQIAFTAITRRSCDHTTTAKRPQNLIFVPSMHYRRSITRGKKQPRVPFPLLTLKGLNAMFKPSRRSAFTLVEMLVVISIIGLLMAIAVPATMRSVENARRMQCSSNMRQTAMAIQTFTLKKNRLPRYLDLAGYFSGGIDPADPSSYAGNVPPHVKLATWQTQILAEVGNLPLHERWYEDRYPVIASGGEFPATSNGYAKFAAPPVATFMCPSKHADTIDDWYNSFVANTGLHVTTPPTTYVRDGQSVTIDFQRSQSRFNGVFNNGYAGLVSATGNGTIPVAPAFRDDDFVDGQSQTLLITENANAGAWHAAGLGDANRWTAVRTIGGKPTVVYPPESRYLQGALWHFADPRGVAGASPIDPNLKLNGGDAYNATLNAATAVPLARPSSFHVDGVNVAFADGSVQFVADSIDYRLYQAWMTPKTRQSDMPSNELPAISEL